MFRIKRCIDCGHCQNLFCHLLKKKVEIWQFGCTAYFDDETSPSITYSDKLNNS